MTGVGCKRDELPLRIALVHAADFGRGAEQCVLALHRSLRGLGHDSTLFVGTRLTDEPGVVEIPYRRGIPGSRTLARALEKNLGWQDIYNPSFRDLVNLIPPETDLVHFHSLWGSNGFADTGALPAITARWPGLITMHDNWLMTGHCAYYHSCNRWKEGCGSCPDLKIPPAIPNDGTRFNWNRKRRLISRSRLGIATVSEWLKDVAQESPILRDKPIVRIYNGIDLETFAPVEPHKRSKLRLKLGIPEGTVAVLLAGQTVEGIRTGIAARHAIAMLNSLPTGLVTPVILGHSAALVAAQLSRPAVTLPFQESSAEMARCYQAADMCLVTSEVETFGRIGAESQACGTPVVAFGAGGIPEVVLDGVGGRVVVPGDLAALAAAVTELAGDAALRATLGLGGRRHVVNNFDEKTIAHRHVAVYRDILMGSR